MIAALLGQILLRAVAELTLCVRKPACVKDTVSRLIAVKTAFWHRNQAMDAAEAAAAKTPKATTRPGAIGNPP